MSLFDELVTEAISNNPALSTLRIVVEKELLHHDILRVLSQSNLLTDLTFIGGTCLRACYGGIRLSEHLDFTGGEKFSQEQLSEMGKILTDGLSEKYGLNVIVTEPTKDKKNVDTWKIKVETRPKQKHMPAQRINIDICRVNSYQKQPMLLLNPYGVDMGTSGLVVQAQSRDEIYADKLLAFALRPNRLKHRDLWDILWLHQQGLKPKIDLVPKKLKDRHLTAKYFLKLFEERQKLLKTDSELLFKEFQNAMQRFLPVEQIEKIIKQEKLWDVIVLLMDDFGSQLSQKLNLF